MWKQFFFTFPPSLYTKHECACLDAKFGWDLFPFGGGKSHQFGRGEIFISGVIVQKIALHESLVAFPLWTVYLLLHNGVKQTVTADKLQFYGKWYTRVFFLAVLQLTTILQHFHFLT